MTDPTLPLPARTAAPADWYPDASTGQERYWDGVVWTEQLRPAATDDTAAVEAETPNKKKRKWPWIVGGIAGIILLFGIIGAVNGGGADDTDAQPVATQAVVDEDVAVPVDTTVPDTTGLTAKEAAALLENAGLDTEFSADQGVVLDRDNWTVLGSVPAAGEPVKTGDTVVVSVTKTKKAASTPAEPAAPQYTLAQENALKSAKSYLEFSGFSKQGLIQQLSSEYGEGYPLDVAQWAADTVGADWNAEAVESAQSYLEFSSFSRDGLYEQLTSEYGAGFTADEALFALTAVGY